jgi:hypothetical protein
VGVGGGDGTVYFGGLAADISTEPPTTAVVVSHSGDGGRTWAAPASSSSAIRAGRHAAG